MVDDIRGKLFQETTTQTRDSQGNDAHRMVGPRSYRYISPEEPKIGNSLGFMFRSIVATFIASLLRMFSSPPKELTASIQAQNPPSLQATQISKLSKPILNPADRPWSMSPQEHDDQASAYLEASLVIAQEPSLTSRPILGKDPQIAAKLAIDPSIGPKTEAKWRECYDTLLSAYTEKVPSWKSGVEEDRFALVDARTLLEKNAPLRYPSSSKEAAITELYDQIILGQYNNTFLEEVALTKGSAKITNSPALYALTAKIVEDNAPVNLFDKCSEKGKAIWRAAYDDLVEIAGSQRPVNSNSEDPLSAEDPLRQILLNQQARRYEENPIPDHLKNLLK